MVFVYWLLFLSSTLAIISVVLVVLVAKKHTRKLDHAETRANEFEQQFKHLTAGAIGMGHRILALEDKLKKIANDPDISSDSDNFAYTQAKQMFAQGADIETVASNCGFSSSEAGLMALVQNRMKQEASSSL